MKPWNRWLAWLAISGLCLGLGATPGSTAAEPPPAERQPDAAPAAPGAGADVGAAAPAVPPRAVPPADVPAAGEDHERLKDTLRAASANRGDRKLFRSPQLAATCFLYALKKKDLNLISMTIALHAATESNNQSNNRELFRLILAQELDKQALDELAEKLSGFQIAGTPAPAPAPAGNTVKVVVTKREGNVVIRRTLTMRLEKAGWKLMDIGGEGELAKPIVVPRKRPRPKVAEKAVQT